MSTQQSPPDLEKLQTMTNAQGFEERQTTKMTKMMMLRYLVTTDAWRLGKGKQARRRSWCPKLTESDIRYVH
jgi:hypothetical protein